MSQDFSASAGAWDRVLLCWSDTPQSPLRRELANILETRSAEAILSTSFKIPENTAVQLSGTNYTGQGVVRSCRAESGSFVLTVSIGSETPAALREWDLDPGVLVVDDFLTEEEEAELLKDFENSDEDNWSAFRVLPPQPLGGSRSVIRRPAQRLSTIDLVLSVLPQILRGLRSPAAIKHCCV